MWSFDTVTQAEILYRELYSRFVEYLDDDGRMLFHTLNRLHVATGMANGTMRWGQTDRLDQIEKMLHSAVATAAEILNGSEGSQKGSK